MTNDLENDLRAMLRERAGDVGAVPARVFDFERDDTGELATVTDLDHRRRRVGPRMLSVAAAVITVVAVAGTVFALRSGNDDAAPPAGPTSTPSVVAPTPTVVPTPTVPRTAALHWFGMGDLNGFSRLGRESDGGYQALYLIRDAEGPREGYNGGTSATNIVTVYEPGEFKPTIVSRWRRATVEGRLFYYGSIPGEGGVGQPSAATRAPSGRWVVVTGLTVTSSPDDVLDRILLAVRPDRTLVQRVPFRIGRVPAGASVGQMRTDLEAPLLATVNIEVAGGEIQFRAEKSVASTISSMTRPTTRTIAGQRVTVDLADGVAAVQLYAGVGVSVQIVPDTTVTPQLRRQFLTMLDSMEWLPTHGFDAEDAVP